MKKTKTFTLSPEMVPQNATLLIQCTDNKFESDRYAISNIADRVIRKGQVAILRNEFYVSMGGLDNGDYWFEMGDRKEKFTVF